jgi:hypothetical protein
VSAKLHTEVNAAVFIVLNEHMSGKVTDDPPELGMVDAHSVLWVCGIPIADDFGDRGHSSGMYMRSQVILNVARAPHRDIVVRERADTGSWSLQMPVTTADIIADKYSDSPALPPKEPRMPVPNVSQVCAFRRSACSIAAVPAIVALMTGQILQPSVAVATPGQVIDQFQVAALCSSQYPETPTYRAGEAYLVAPRDAYSWRCQRVSTSASGGTITDLPVDPTTLCTGPAEPIPATPNWRCI